MWECGGLGSDCALSIGTSIFFSSLGKFTSGAATEVEGSLATMGVLVVGWEEAGGVAVGGVEIVLDVESLLEGGFVHFQYGLRS